MYSALCVNKKYKVRLLKVLFIIFIFCLLTALTQIGGLVYLASLLLNRQISNREYNKYSQGILKVLSFLTIYTLTTFLIVPLFAKAFGRVPLPLTEINNLKPLNILTCFLNRNYVKSELKQTVFDVAKQMNEKFPGTTLNYLDANFPFVNRFPLFPHLSHNDGEKLDLSFCYTDKKTKRQTNECPSFIGYGICEEPLPGEKNTADLCSENGYWQYSFLQKITPQGNKFFFVFDSDKTKELINFFASQETIGKIFIEPHLKKRLKLTADKIRFHGCQTVRHDDHIHVQLK
jgi:hypothetical protein